MGLVLGLEVEEGWGWVKLTSRGQPEVLPNHTTRCGSVRASSIVHSKMGEPGLQYSGSIAPGLRVSVPLSGESHIVHLPRVRRGCVCAARVCVCGEGVCAARVCVCGEGVCVRAVHMHMHMHMHAVAAWVELVVDVLYSAT